MRRDGRTRRQEIDAGVPTAWAGQVQAVRAGDFLFLSGLMAVDARGALAPEARVDAARPHFGDPAQLQTDYMLVQAQRICRKSGTDLANVVRAQQFHTGLDGFNGAWRAWQKHLPGRHLPYSAIEVPALGVPGAVVMLDLWIYVP